MINQLTNINKICGKTGRHKSISQVRGNITNSTDRQKVAINYVNFMISIIVLHIGKRHMVRSSRIKVPRFRRKIRMTCEPKCRKNNLLYHFRRKCVCRWCRNKSWNRQCSRVGGTNRDMINNSLFPFRLNRASCDDMPSLLAVITKFLWAILCNMTKSFIVVALDKMNISALIPSLCYICHINRSTSIGFVFHSCLSCYALFLLKELIHSSKHPKLVLGCGSSD